MSEKTSESVYKKRLYEFTPGPSLRPEREISKSIVLDKNGFNYNGNYNGSIRIRCFKDEVIKIIHKDNGEKCHIGMPVYDGNTYMPCHFDAPSVGSINYGFTEKNIYIYDLESPDILCSPSNKIIFLCSSGEHAISIKDMSGREVVLAEVDPPDFAMDARCWSFSPQGYNLGTVLKYFITGSINSGGSILIVPDSQEKYIPWWELHSIKLFGNKWKVCLKEKLSFSAKPKTLDNKKVSSLTGDVIYVNGIEQPVMLASCFDKIEINSFIKDKKLGNLILYQNSNKKITINESTKLIDISCGNYHYDPYDPYAEERFSFDGDKVIYYGDMDYRSGNVIYISKDGWDFSAISSIKPYHSGFIEYVRLSNVGSHVIVCEDTGNAGKFFHVDVVNENILTKKNEELGSPKLIQKLKNSNISIWFSGNTVSSSRQRYHLVNADYVMTENSKGKDLYETVYEKIKKIIFLDRVLSGDLLFVRIQPGLFGMSDIHTLNSAFNDVLSIKGIQFAYDYKSLSKNEFAILNRMNSNFVFDISSHMISSYPSDLLSVHYTYVDVNNDSDVDTIKEAITLGNKKLLLNGEKAMLDKAISSASSLVYPSFNQSFNYFCRRKGENLENINVLAISHVVNNLFKNDPIYSSQSGVYEIFRMISEIASYGMNTCFLLPNGDWNFPFAKIANWNMENDVSRGMADIISKIYEDFRIEIGISIHSKSLQENEKNFVKLCNSLSCKKILILDSCFISDSEIYAMVNRLNLNGIKCILEGSPRLIHSGLVSSSFCLGNWVWLSEYRGAMPKYLHGLVREI